MGTDDERPGLWALSPEEQERRRPGWVPRSLWRYWIYVNAQMQPAELLRAVLLLLYAIVELLRFINHMTGSGGAGRH